LKYPKLEGPATNGPVTVDEREVTVKSEVNSDPVE
jgi:hypothetical protein